MISNKYVHIINHPVSSQLKMLVVTCRHCDLDHALIRRATPLVLWICAKRNPGRGGGPTVGLVPGITYVMHTQLTVFY
jgi:hypothetical protein